MIIIYRLWGLPNWPLTTGLKKLGVHYHHELGPIFLTFLLWITALISGEAETKTRVLQHHKWKMTSYLSSLGMREDMLCLSVMNNSFGYPWNSNLEYFTIVIHYRKAQHVFSHSQWWKVRCHLSFMMVKYSRLLFQG
jgi:hypothetical protein